MSDVMATLSSMSDARMMEYAQSAQAIGATDYAALVSIIERHARHSDDAAEALPIAVIGWARIVANGITETHMPSVALRALRSEELRRIKRIKESSVIGDSIDALVIAHNDNRKNCERIAKDWTKDLASIPADDSAILNGIADSAIERASTFKALRSTEAQAIAQTRGQDVQDVARAMVRAELASGERIPGGKLSAASVARVTGLPCHSPAERKAVLARACLAWARLAHARDPKRDTLEIASVALERQTSNGPTKLAEGKADARVALFGWDSWAMPAELAANPLMVEKIGLLPLRTTYPYSTLKKAAQDRTMSSHRAVTDTAETRKNEEDSRKPCKRPTALNTCGCGRKVSDANGALALVTLDAHGRHPLVPCDAPKPGRGDFMSCGCGKRPGRLWIGEDGTACHRPW